MTVLFARTGHSPLVHPPTLAVVGGEGAGDDPIMDPCPPRINVEYALLVYDPVTPGPVGSSRSGRILIYVHKGRLDSAVVNDLPQDHTFFYKWSLEGGGPWSMMEGMLDWHDRPPTPGTH